GGAACGAALLGGMLVIALYRSTALPLLHAAGAATVLVYAGAAAAGSFHLVFPAASVSIEAAPVSPFLDALRPAGLVLAISFLVAGLSHGSRIVAARPLRAAMWAGWAAAVPTVILFALWVLFGNIDRDPYHAA